MGEDQVQEQDVAIETPPDDVGEDVMTPEDIANLTDAFPREKLYIPEWKRAVWVWAYTLASERLRWVAMDGTTDQAEKVNRGMVMRVIEAVRISGDHASDGGPAPRLFDKEKHWAWLLGQPAGLIRRICEKSEQLNGERNVTEEQMRSFFVTQAAVVRCLQHTALACDACTDCPRKSEGLCPSDLYASLWLPTM